MKRITKNRPRIRIWGRPSRKIMTQTIPSDKDKFKKRAVRKKILQKELKEKET